MPYTKCRLAEALQIIRHDTEHRNGLEAAKLLETQYRDGFHLRKSTSNHSSRIPGWPDNHDPKDVRTFNAPKRKRQSTPDGDYGEECDKSRGKKHRKSDEISTFGPVNTSAAISHTSKHKRSNLKKVDHSAVETRPTASLVTLKLSSERGRNFLRQMVKEHPGMKINMYNIVMKQKLSKDLSSWRSISGGPQRADRTPLELDKDYWASKNQFNIDETFEEHFADPDPDVAGILRSGKARATTIPTKRKRRNTDEEQDADPVVHKSREIDCQEPERTSQSIGGSVKPPNWKANSPPIVTPSTGAYDDVISIASSCEDNSCDTIQIVPSRPSALTNEQRCVSPPAPNSPPQSSSYSYIPQKHNSTQSENTNCQGSIETHTTYFSHPINFRILNPNECTFHRDYRHPLFGHGKITAEYIVYPNRPGHLEETGDGHRARNKPADGMCVKCALDYMQTIRCPRHTFTSIPSTPKRTHALRENSIVYFNDMFRVRRSDPSRNLKALAEICSLCPAPATTRCCAIQTRNAVGNPCRLPNESLDAAKARIERTSPRRSVSVNTSVGSNANQISNTNNNSSIDASLSRISLTPSTPTSISTTSIQPPLYGCGLYLCGACHKLVDDKCQGYMQRNRNYIIKEVQGRGLDARADLEFRFCEGLLYKAWAGGRGNGK